MQCLSLSNKEFNLKKIIIISGKQYSGKDTVAKILLERLSNFSRIGIGDAIKYEYAKKNGLTFDEIIENKHLYRTGLIELGNWGRSQNPDYWLNSLIEMENDIIVPDIRVEHEIDVFKRQGAFLLRVEASREARSKRGTITNENDPTETSLDNYNKWDYVLNNDSDYETLFKNTEPLIEAISTYFN